MRGSRIHDGVTALGWRSSASQDANTSTRRHLGAKQLPSFVNFSNATRTQDVAGLRLDAFDLTHVRGRPAGVQRQTELSA